MLSIQSVRTPISRARSTKANMGAEPVVTRVLGRSLSRIATALKNTGANDLMSKREASGTT